MCAGAYLADLASAIALDKYRGARALIIGNAGSHAKFASGLTCLECDGLLCSAANGPITPIPAEAAITVVEQPALR